MNVSSRVQHTMMLCKMDTPLQLVRRLAIPCMVSFPATSVSKYTLQDACFIVIVPVGLPLQVSVGFSAIDVGCRWVCVATGGSSLRVLFVFVVP